MNGLPAGLLYTQDGILRRRLMAYLQSLCAVCPVDEPVRLQRMAAQMGSGLLLLDLCAIGSAGLLEEIRRDHPDMLVIAIGEEMSDPMRRAVAAGVFGIMQPEPMRVEFQILIRRALQFLAVVEERDLLRDRSPAAPAAPPEPAAGRRNPLAAFMKHFARTCRRFDDLESLLASVVEAVSDSMLVTRAGLFLCDPSTRRYRLYTALNALPETESMHFEADDPLVRWMEIHAHIISRSSLSRHVSDPSDFLLLRRALDAMGAEALVPLHGRGRLMGWLFLGKHGTGAPLDEVDLQELMVVADYSSKTMENALLQGELAREKELGDVLFHVLPMGVAAVSDDGIIRAANRMLRVLLDLSEDPLEGCPVEDLRRPLAGMLRTALAKKDTARDSIEWSAPSGRKLALEVQRLQPGGPFGALALVRDLTRLRALEAKQEEIDRAAFWTELAASMSHEIRNPLVAIKTFAQLLPERFDDPEFRKEFSSMVSTEVDRLNGMVDQINAFAHPPQPEMAETDPGQLASLAIKKAKALYGHKKPPAVKTVVPPRLPAVFTDKQILAEGLAHMLCNAFEAVSGRADPRVGMAVGVRDEGGRPHIEFRVTDNGPGLADAARAKLFSPFFTTKARGLGLGLAIARRVAMDHEGRVEVEEAQTGASVVLVLPAAGRKEKAHEAPADRG